MLVAAASSGLGPLRQLPAHSSSQTNGSVQPSLSNQHYAALTLTMHAVCLVAAWPAAAAGATAATAGAGQPGNGQPDATIDTLHVNRWPPYAKQYAPNTVLVRFKKSASAAAVASASAVQPPPGLQLISLHGDHLAATASIPRGSSSGRTAGAAVAAAAAAPAAIPSSAVMQFSITDGSSVEAKVAELRRNPNVDVAEPVFIRYPSKEPNDPLYKSSNRYGGMWHLAQVQAPRAWATATGSKAVS